MAKERQKRQRKSHAVLPLVIASDADLAAHIDALVKAHPIFSKARKVAGEMPLRKLAPGFGGLCWIIIGQQISTAAGRAIYARTEEALAGITPESVSCADDALLKGAGLSTPKVKTLRAVSEAVLSGDLNVDDLGTQEAESAVARLCSVKGIGPWTAQVYLLFALGHADIFPAGDLALKEAVRMLLQKEERPGEKELSLQAEKWHPHRSAAARLLWAYYGAVKHSGVPV